MKAALAKQKLNIVQQQFAAGREYKVGFKFDYNFIYYLFYFVGSKHSSYRF